MSQDDDSLNRDFAAERTALRLVLCDACTAEIQQGDTIIFDPCLLHTARNYRARVKALISGLEQAIAYANAQGSDGGDALADALQALL